MSSETLQRGGRHRTAGLLAAGFDGAELDGAASCSVRCLRLSLGGCRSGRGALVTFHVAGGVRADAARWLPRWLNTTPPTGRLLLGEAGDLVAAGVVDTDVLR